MSQNHPSMAPTPHKLHTFHGGIHLPEHKSESTGSPVVRAPLPKRLIVSLQQHIGNPAEPLVAPGDKVLKGQTIGAAGGYVSAAVHAPTSGTVLEVGKHAIPHPSGLTAPCIVIEPDGEDRWVELVEVKDPSTLSVAELRQRIAAAGIVGLGGAAFPTAVKLAPPEGTHIHTLIINGAECEPYITCDDLLMRERASDVLNGIAIMRRIVGANACLVGIEDNKPEAIAAMTAAAAGTGIEVVKVPTLYPTGGEKQLIKVLTGLEVPTRGIPAQLGIVCQNVATAATVWRAVRYGEPLISRIVTLTGGALDRPHNVEALIGTPVEELLALAGPHLGADDKLVMGGPMMGITLADLDVPTVKATNCLLAATPADQPNQGEAMPCIRCGECTRVCPASLLPQQMYWHARAKEFDKVQDYNLFDCIECGCCAYVCPSHIPLVQYYRFAKTEIWAQEREKKKADLARQRHEFKQMRQEREKREKAEKHAAAAARKAAGGDAPADEKAAAKQPDADKKAAIQAAMERAKAKRAAQQAEQADTNDNSAPSKPAASTETTVTDSDA